MTKQDSSYSLTNPATKHKWQRLQLVLGSCLLSLIAAVILLAAVSPSAAAGSNLAGGGANPVLKSANDNAPGQVSSCLSGHDAP
jgi:hypothetical protein